MTHIHLQVMKKKSSKIMNENVKMDMKIPHKYDSKKYLRFGLMLMSFRLVRNIVERDIINNY